MGGLVLDIWIEWLVRVLVRFAKEFGTGKWPVQQAKVTGAFCPKVGYGCEKAEINYTYRVEGETYVGTNVKPFTLSNSAEIYAAQFPKGKQIRVRVKPNDPDYSLLIDSDNSVEKYII